MSQVCVHKAEESKYSFTLFNISFALSAYFHRIMYNNYILKFIGMANIVRHGLLF